MFCVLVCRMMLILGDFVHTLVIRDYVTWCITDSDANVAEIWFFQMQNCISWHTNEDDDQTFT